MFSFLLIRPLKSPTCLHSWNTIQTPTLQSKVKTYSFKKNVRLNNETSWTYFRSFCTTSLTYSSSNSVHCNEKKTLPNFFENKTLPLDPEELRSPSCKIRDPIEIYSEITSIPASSSFSSFSSSSSVLISPMTHPSSIEKTTPHYSSSSSSSTPLVFPPTTFKFDFYQYLNHPSIPLPPLDPGSNLYLQSKRHKIGQGAQDALLSNSCPSDPHLLSSLLEMDIQAQPKEAWEVYCQLTMRGKASFVPTLCPHIPPSCHSELLRAMKRFLNHSYAEYHQVHLPIYVVRTRIEYILETMRLHRYPLEDSDIFILIDMYGRSAMYQRMEFWLDYYFQCQLEPNTKLLNSVLSGYVNSIQPDLAEAWYHQCLAKGVPPNRMTFALLLRLYFRTRNLKAALLIGELAYPDFHGRYLSSLSSSSSSSSSSFLASTSSSLSSLSPSASTSSSASDIPLVNETFSSQPTKNASPLKLSTIQDFNSFLDAIPTLAQIRKEMFYDSTSRGLDQAAAYWIMLIGSYHFEQPALQKLVWQFVGYSLLRPEINLLSTLNAIVYILCCTKQEIEAEIMVQKFMEFNVQPNSITYNHLLKMYGKFGRIEKLNALALYLLNGSTRFTSLPTVLRPFLHSPPKIRTLLNPLSIDILCHYNTGAQLYFWQKIRSSHSNLKTNPSYLRFRLAERKNLCLEQMCSEMEKEKRNGKNEMEKEIQKLS